MAYPGNDLRQLNARDFTVRLNRLLAQDYSTPAKVI